VLEKRGKKGSTPKKRHTTKPTHKGPGGSDDIGGAVKHILGDVWNGLKALGQPEPVTITWYIRIMSLSCIGAHSPTGTPDMICSIQAAGATVTGTLPYALIAPIKSPLILTIFYRTLPLPLRSPLKAGRRDPSVLNSSNVSQFLARE
jgi:hypothetical protein